MNGKPNERNQLVDIPIIDIFISEWPKEIRIHEKHQEQIQERI